MDEQALFLVYMHNVANIGNRRLRLLPRRETFISMLRASAPEAAYIPDECRHDLLCDRWIERTEPVLRYLAAHQIRVLSGRELPDSFMTLEEPPVLLYGIGNTELIRRRGVAVAGTRRATRYGRECAAMFASALSSGGLCIVGGMSGGIEEAAHRASLDKPGRSVAVLPGGVDYIYPAENRGLYETLCEKGLVVSEYPLSVRPQKEFFAQRNRLISAIAECVLVVEAGEKSGTNSTVESALEQNKDVFAVPGNITSPSSYGTNRLIRQGCSLALEPEDILEAFGVAARGKRQSVQLPENTDPVSLAVIEKLSVEDLSGTELEATLNFSASEIASALTILELQDCICRLPGGIYTLHRQ